MKLRIKTIRIRSKGGIQLPLRGLKMTSRKRKSQRKSNQWQATKNSWSLTTSIQRSTTDLYLKESRVSLKRLISTLIEESHWILPLKSSNSFLNKRPNRKEIVFKGYKKLSVTVREPSIKLREVPVSRNPSRSTAMSPLRVSQFSLSLICGRL